MYVVAVNRKAVVGYKQVTGRVEKILPGRRRLGMFGCRDTGRSALMSFGNNRYTGAIGEGMEEGDNIPLYVFPDQSVYTSFPEGDVWDIDGGDLPEGRLLIKDKLSAKKAYSAKYGILIIKLAAGGIMGAVLWAGLSPVAGSAFFAAVAIQSLWRTITSGTLARLYKTDSRKLMYSGRATT